ncbi:MAG: signal recognition particle protein [Rhodospirillales bacterium]|jgi:signal recognition particle subunit SRP54|nr:signal recognition particle protein [Rhodospirillales bacterium]MBT3905468.1 signal recognition particle protein [Rhodospirillaceae bacterium]MBT6220012.1 signal recognition particle protein [Rhodospirillaceae bacterium]MBT6362551.1 signal recognition particle protein [Rhodospirillaceae bacterium]MBT7770932.1 signal recognition particle protein [Rhodospirillales bacterium]
MFESLSNRLSGIFEGLTKRGALREADVDAALREVRVALLEADVALEVVKDFVAAVRERAVGHEVLSSVTPGQMMIKVVHDNLVDVLGAGENEINLVGTPPVAILMVGLQGSGKTTTSAKLARRLQIRDKKKVLMASLDIYRPAAQKQLAVLGEQAEVATLPVVFGEQPLAIANRAMDTGRKEGYDVVVLDTAGRLHIDQKLMDEVAAVSAATSPTETLLVADALTGQDAVNVAKEFHEKAGVTGIALTRVDGDARGGAALSMRSVTGCPIKLMGTGEGLDAIDSFQAERVAGSILGMGDVVGLVEKAAEQIDQEEAEAMAKKLIKGRFTLDDMLQQLGQIKKMGDMEGLLGMLPGVGKIKNQLKEANVNDKMIARQEAIILSMTQKERENSKILNGSRRRRIAAGAGTTVQEVNRLLKQYKQMTLMMKKMGKKGKRGLMGGMGGMMPGMMPPMPPIR